MHNQLGHNLAQDSSFISFRMVRTTSCYPLVAKELMGAVWTTKPPLLPLLTLPIFIHTNSANLAESWDRDRDGDCSR